MEDSLDPTVPASIGALLAEEWTIDPFSVLPSFVEMVMIEGASLSTRRALFTAMEATVRQLDTYRYPEELDEASLSVFDWKFISLLIRRRRAHLAQAAKRVLRQYGPELRCLAVYLVERQCLNTKSCATLSESVYSVTRVRLGAPEDKSDPSRRKLVSLTGSDKTRLALCLALAPYLREKIEAAYQRFRRSSSQSTLGSWRQKFVAIYPFLRMSLNGMRVLCLWRFLLGQSVFYDPTSLLLQQVVRRVTREDSGSSSPESNALSDSMLPTSDDHERHKSLGQKMAAYLLSASFAASWATLIRSEWQTYSQQRGNGQESNAPAGGLLVPPPPPSPSAAGDTPLDICPLCQRQRVQPTASTSGHVFCLSCILPFVKEHMQCPVTGADCLESQIIRLYEPTHSQNEPSAADT